MSELIHTCSRSPKKSTDTEIIEQPDGTVTEIGLSRVIATEDDDSDKTLVDETEIRKPPSPTPSVAQTLPPDYGTLSSNYGTLRAADITSKESNNFDKIWGSLNQRDRKIKENAKVTTGSKFISCRVAREHEM